VKKNSGYTPEPNKKIVQLLLYFSDLGGCSGFDSYPGGYLKNGLPQLSRNS
jgi:hypothetical protein